MIILTGIFTDVLSGFQMTNDILLVSFPYIFKADDNGNGIQGKVDQGIGNFKIPEMSGNLLQKQCKPAESAREKISGAYKTFKITNDVDWLTNSFHPASVRLAWHAGT